LIVESQGTQAWLLAYFSCECTVYEIGNSHYYP
jgi:hypothetical protein